MNGLSSIQTFKLTINASLCLLLQLHCGVVEATSHDSDQPLKVEAGRFEAFKSENISVFRDDVVIVKGSIKINAQEARLQVIDGEVKQATILGNPVAFEQQNDDGEIIRGWADRMEYDADKNIVDLTGNAKLHHGEDIFESETIHYDTLNQRVHAQSEQSSDERVQIVFMPRNNKTTPDTEKQQTPPSDVIEENDADSTSDNP